MHGSRSELDVQAMYSGSELSLREKISQAYDQFMEKYKALPRNYKIFIKILLALGIIMMLIGIPLITSSAKTTAGYGVLITGIVLFVATAIEHICRIHNARAQVYTAELLKEFSADISEEEGRNYGLPAGISSQSAEEIHTTSPAGLGPQHSYPAAQNKSSGSQSLQATAKDGFTNKLSGTSAQSDAAKHQKPLDGEVAVEVTACSA